jgi:hypothetical protein
VHATGLALTAVVTCIQPFLSWTAAAELQELNSQGCGAPPEEPIGEDAGVEDGEQEAEKKKERKDQKNYYFNGYDRRCDGKRAVRRAGSQRTAHCI